MIKEMLLLFILIYNVLSQEIAMVFSAAKVNRQDELVMVLYFILGDSDVGYIVMLVTCS